MSPEELSDRLLRFAARIGKVVDALPDTRLGRHVAGQLVRCGASPPPNYEEGRAAESRADFIHKIKIVLKELRETRSWLRYIVMTEMLPETKLGDLLDEAASYATSSANRSSPRKVSTNPKPDLNERARFRCTNPTRKRGDTRIPRLRVGLVQRNRARPCSASICNC
jgi:four helix bundle protein